ncbi:MULTISPECIES: hypothetical protein [unclassified Frankia]|uniref:hypothetical protein n=1 Tax=unclassified Frankia TaxID=2632575 RepID=UPI002AD584F1|nr:MULTISPECIES: hypothetical protein [unclassified Frankia]
MSTKVLIRNAGDNIARRETFDAGSLRGERWPVGPYLGRLPDDWVRAYRADENNSGIEYLVSSYGTPIGWVTGTGRVVTPDTWYSMTTSRHQGIARRNLATHSPWT